MKNLISFVIPAYNEEVVVHELIKRLTRVINSLPSYEFEVIIVENGSTDNTIEKLLHARKKDKRIKILQLAKNTGTCDGAIIAGLQFAQGDAAIIMMADLQDIPELIPKFLEKWKEGYDVVYGIVKKRTGIPTYKKIGTYLFYKIMNWLTKKALPEYVSDFRLIDKQVYKIIAKIPEHNTFFRGLVTWTGFRQTGIPFERPERFAGESKAYLLTVINVALNGIFSFSNLPLRLSWILAIILIVSSMLMFLLNNSLLAILLLIFSFIACLLGIQGEYIARIFEETRNRPNFIIRRVHGITFRNSSNR